MKCGSKTILVFTTRNSFGFRSLLKGISVTSRAKGWSIRIIEHEPLKINANWLIREWRPLGCLTYYHNPADFPTDHPFVHVNPIGQLSNAWCVRHDSTGTGHAAAHELLRIGCETFAYVEAKHTAWSDLRGASYAATLDEFGKRVHTFSLPLMPKDPLSHERTLRIWLKKLPTPCGLFAANDFLAESVTAAALSLGLSLPNQLAILGVDDDVERCENAPISLSSIAPDFFQGGRRACELLSDLLANPDTRPRIETYGDIGVTRRASTCIQRKVTPAIAEICEYIRTEAASGISALDVIAHMKRNRRTAELAFKAAMGHTIGDELQRVRLEHAVRLLADPTIQIGEIPGRVGYVSQNQLERIFRRRYGKTMRAFRKH